MEHTFNFQKNPKGKLNQWLVSYPNTNNVAQIEQLTCPTPGAAANKLPHLNLQPSTSNQKSESSHQDKVPLQNPTSFLQFSQLYVVVKLNLDRFHRDENKQIKSLRGKGKRRRVGPVRSGPEIQLDALVSPIELVRLQNDVSACFHTVNTLTEWMNWTDELFMSGGECSDHYWTLPNWLESQLWVFVCCTNY